MNENVWGETGTIWDLLSDVQRYWTRWPLRQAGWILRVVTLARVLDEGMKR